MQEGVKSILLSGPRATVIMEEGTSLDEAKLKASIEAKRMTFISLETKTVPRPKAAYVLAAAGSS